MLLSLLLVGPELAPDVAECLAATMIKDICPYMRDFETGHLCFARNRKLPRSPQSRE